MLVSQKPSHTAEGLQRRSEIEPYRAELMVRHRPAARQKRERTDQEQVDFRMCVYNFAEAIGGKPTFVAPVASRPCASADAHARVSAEQGLQVAMLGLWRRKNSKKTPMTHVHDKDVSVSLEWMKKAYEMRQAMPEPLPKSAAAFYADTSVASNRPTWVSEFDTALYNEVAVRSGAWSAERVGAAARFSQHITDFGNQIRSDFGARENTSQQGGQARPVCQVRWPDDYGDEDRVDTLAE